MQFGQPRPETAVVFDSSLEDIGQVLSLATLLASEAAREVRLGSLSVSRNSLETAALVDVLVRFYRGEEPRGALAGVSPEGSAVPIGMFAETEVEVDAPPMVRGVVDRVGPDGGPLYPRGIAGLNDTADPVAVIRNALSAQQDNRAVVVLAGAPVNLLGLLALPEGSTLVANKVRELVIAHPPEPGFDTLVDRWPSPVVRAGEDLNVRYPVVAIERDLVWTENHPVVDAYRAAELTTQDIPAYAAAAILYAIRPDDNYFGTIVGPLGSPRLTAAAGQLGEIVPAIRELVRRRPPERRRGRGG